MSKRFDVDLLRVTPVVFCFLTIAFIVLGFAKPPHPGPSHYAAIQALIRLGLTLAASVTFVLGPGLALRCLTGWKLRVSLSFVFLPGLGLLVGTGLVAWALASRVDPHLISAVILVPLAAGLALIAARTDFRDIVPPAEMRVLAVIGVLLLVVTAKAEYSLGPPGELYGGTTSRTLEAGDRSDSRVSYHVAQLVAHGTAPYSGLGESNFLPWSFSTRGPLAGLAASPVLLLSGAMIPVGPPEEPWAPFDTEGFAAYRIFMMTLALVLLLAMFGLTVALAGQRAGLFVVGLAALTPFLVHEVYFTWPKLLAATFVVLGAQLLVLRKPGRAGLAVGAGYLVHPLALFGIPTLASLLVLMNWHRIRTGLWAEVGRALLWLAAGAGLWIGLWGILNGSHNTQQGFIGNFFLVDGEPVVSFSAWLAGRVTSLLNTVVPLYLFLFHGGDHSINSTFGPSPAAVRFNFQYWTTLPFGVGILFFPLLVAGIFRGARRAPWLVGLTVVVPLLLFGVYWGSAWTGLLREGLHVWVVTLLLLYAWFRFRDRAYTWGGCVTERVLLTSRVGEIALMMLLPTVLASRKLVNHDFAVTDGVSLIVLVGGLAWLAWYGWWSSADSGTGCARSKVAKSDQLAHVLRNGAEE